MKNIMIIAIFLFSVASLMIATKPTDQECIARARGAAAAGLDEQLINLVQYNRYTVQIEDHLFYKKMYSAIDGHELAIGIFGAVILK